MKTLVVRHTNFEHFNIRISKIASDAQVAKLGLDHQPKKQKFKKQRNDTCDCLEQVRREAAAAREANGSAARSRRLHLNCVVEGLAQGRAESQEAAYERGLAEGKKLGSKVGHEVAYNTGLAKAGKFSRQFSKGHTRRC